VPFSSKATGVPLAASAARIMAGERIADLDLPEELAKTGRYAVKEAVMPWSRFPGSDVTLGPEMRSTGEVMGIDYHYARALYKAITGMGMICCRFTTMTPSCLQKDAARKASSSSNAMTKSASP